MSVYILWHTNPDTDDSKLLGVYSSKIDADEKIKSLYNQLPGFNQYPNGFSIDQYTVGEDHWVEGFVSVES
jgi:hypothetical protein